MTASDRARLTAQLDPMGRAGVARERRPVLRDTHVTLSHGSGGKASQTLIEGLLAPILDHPAIHAQEDSAVLPLGAAGERLAFTTDAFVVSPLFFPGGDIGRLAVHGTINDLASAGAQPLALAAALVLEEGLPVDVLRRVMESMAAASRDAGVPIVTGDTKVVPRGAADQLFVATSGIGLVRPGVCMSLASARPGDRVLLSGTIGDHGIAVMLARDALELETAISSDSAALHTLAGALLEAAPHARCLKDPTRGGVATALNEIARQSGTGVAIDEACVPVRPDVHAACEILGLDPLHIANEGKLLAIVAPDEIDAALAALRGHPLGGDAAVIGEVLAEPAGMVVSRTAVGGSRVVDMLVGDPLPRIC